MLVLELCQERILETINITVNSIIPNLENSITLEVNSQVEGNERTWYTLNAPYTLLRMLRTQPSQTCFAAPLDGGVRSQQGGLARRASHSNAPSLRQGLLAKHARLGGAEQGAEGRGVGGVEELKILINYLLKIKNYQWIKKDDLNLSGTLMQKLKKYNINYKVMITKEFPLQ